MINQLIDYQSQEIANYICSDPNLIIPIYLEICKDIIPKLMNYSKDDIELKIKSGRKFIIKPKNKNDIQFISFTIPTGMENSPIFNNPDILLERWSNTKNKRPICYDGLLFSNNVKSICKETLINKNWIESIVLDQLRTKNIYE